jgi:hypothetical protein
MGVLSDQHHNCSGPRNFHAKQAPNDFVFHQALFQSLLVRGSCPNRTISNVMAAPRQKRRKLADLVIIGVVMTDENVVPRIVRVHKAKIL